VGQQYAASEDRSGSAGELDYYDLQQYVPIPAAGVKAVTEVEGSKLEITVQWKDEDGGDIDAPDPFVPGQVYGAEIDLTAQGSWRFDAKSSFEYKTAAVAELTGDNTDTKRRILSVLYLPAEDRSGSEGGTVLDYDLQHYVPIPTDGSKPVTEFDGPGLKIRVQWKDEAGVDIDAPDSFVLDQVYRAKIDLMAQDPWSFDATFPFEYKTAAVTGLTGKKNNDNTHTKHRILEVLYLQTAEIVPITEIDLTHYIPAPVTRRKPVIEFSTAIYKGTVVWEIGGDSAPEGAFQPGTRYSAKVTLTTLNEYKFATDNPRVFHIGGIVGAISPGNDDHHLSVLITFPATELTRLTRFSGKAGGEEPDSIIDMIRTANGQKSMYFLLTPETEEVQFDKDTDFGQAGLVLYYDSSAPTDPGKTNSPAELELDGGGMTIDLTGPPNGNPLITVGSGVKLTLRNITLKGLVSQSAPLISDKPGTDDENNSAPLILVKNGGELILEEGALLTENENDNGKSGGVRVEKGGRFTMNGGEIFHIASEDEGSVFVDWGSMFTMNGGAIRDNKSTFKTGGVYVLGSFIMHNGTISGNAVVTGGDQSGGGILLDKTGTMVMHNGTISGNKATNGGGVSMLHSDNVFVMNNGTISGNYAGEAGGGVYMGSGSFIINYGGSISGNVAKERGGGVAMNSGTFTMNYGLIADNQVESTWGRGGGVYMGDNPEGGSGIFNMNLGGIRHNGINVGGSTEDEGGKGCGVYLTKASAFRKTGGTIYGLLISDGNGWEETNYQNHYQKMVHKDPLNDSDDPSDIYYGPPEYENGIDAYEDENLGGRGYAVYWENDPDDFIDYTLVGPREWLPPEE
jgi:hypothetical protein